MQELVIDLRGKSEDWAALELSSLMLFPNPLDNSRYRMWTVRQLLGFAADLYSKGIEAKLSHNDQISLSRQIGNDFGETIHPLGGWSALANATLAPGMKKPLQVETREKLQTGRIVGLVLCCALDKNRGIKGAAEEICNHISSTRFDRLLEEKDIKPIRQTPRSFVNNIWPSWKSAAHLWGACIRHNLLMDVESPYRWLSLDQCPSGIAGFIEQAEALLDIASKHIPPRGPRNPILSHETCWKILR